MEYRGVLCITGDSAPLEKTEIEAAKVAGMCGCRLILLHVVERWSNTELLVTDSPEWKSVLDNWLAEGMELLEELLRTQGLYSIKKVVRGGEKAAEALAVAAEQNVSLIVAPNYHGWKGLLSNSFTKEIITNSPCPVLWVNE
jgi:nucleotide-binding universal stress UspA family protein